MLTISAPNAPNAFRYFWYICMYSYHGSKYRLILICTVDKNMADMTKAARRYRYCQYDRDITVINTDFDFNTKNLQIDSDVATEASNLYLKLKHHG